LAGNDVVLLDRSSAIGGQLALAGAAPAHAEMSRSLGRNYGRLLEAAGVDLRLETEVETGDVAALEPDAVVAATGARPYVPPFSLEDVETVQAWDVLFGPIPRGKRVAIADWGGDAAGLDCAELLAAADNRVTLAVASVATGEGVHQYQRNLYLARLYGLGVTIEHHLQLAGAVAGRAIFRNVFAQELEHETPVDLLVLALGRVPVDDLAPRLRALGLAVEEAGDCRSPRSAEEAILEGTLAARRVAHRVGDTRASS
jgi:pyruvate/2-oxoglutarate dehydrogenase complex dihydrolipoamide dehydrogenase (E3) component